MIYLLLTVNIKFRTLVCVVWEAIDVRMTNGENLYYVKCYGVLRSLIASSKFRCGSLEFCPSSPVYDQALFR